MFTMSQREDPDLSQRTLRKLFVVSELVGILLCHSQNLTRGSKKGKFTGGIPGFSKSRKGTCMLRKVIDLLSLSLLHIPVVCLQTITLQLPNTGFLFLKCSSKGFNCSESLCSPVSPRVHLQ